MKLDSKSEIALAPDIEEVKQDILALKHDLSALMEKEGQLLAALIASFGADESRLAAGGEHRTEA